MSDKINELRYEKGAAKLWKMAGCTFLAFVLYVGVILSTDVQAIGPKNTEVGLATIDGAVSSRLAYDHFWYNVTEVSGGLIIAVAFGFALLGLYQLIRRRSLLKVDADILALGGLYASVIAFYMFFEKVIINYRPVLMENEIEASFPSSHTLLAACVMISAMQQFYDRIENETYRKISIACCAVLMLVTIGGRILSGVHWLTDIIGSLLLSASLLLAYFGVLCKIK